VNTIAANADVVDLQLLTANQNMLNRRLLWLFFVPFIITAVIVVMFFRISDRLADVELGTKLVTIERVIESDNNYAWAVDQYESLARRSSNAQVFARLGLLYFLLDPENNKEIAIRNLEKAKTIDPSYWETYRSLTFVQLADQPREAIKAGQTALRLNQNDANTYNNLAWIYASDNPDIANLQLAQEYAEKAVKLTMNKQANFLDTLAGIYLKRGYSDRAFAALSQAKAAALDQRGYAKKIQADIDYWFPNSTP
jgi:tetratricopeptide (TPR) repeat protein